MPPDNTETRPLEGEALQAHVTKLLSDHMQDVDKRFCDTMEQLEGLETTFTAKVDAKFKEVLACLPPPPLAHSPPPRPTFLGCAQRVLNPPTQTSAAGTAAAGVAGAAGVTQALDAQLDDYYGEDEYEGEYVDDFTVD
jgi:hypothetical protein